MTINWESNIVLWGEPFRTHANNMQTRKRFYIFMHFNPDISLAELDIWQSASLYSFFWQRTAHLGTLHKQCIKSSIHPEIMKILKPFMVLEVTNELLLTMKKGKAIVSLLWHDLIQTFSSAMQLWIYLKLNLINLAKPNNYS